MAEPQNPSEWFDQFPEAQDWPEGGQWCARHWAPCPLLGANGIGAATELMQVFVTEMLPPSAKSPDAMNREMEKAGHLCCKLGDERMHEIWGRWPPAKAPGEAS